MTVNDGETPPSSGSASAAGSQSPASSATHAALGAAGEAVAFFAGAPIAGAADAAVGLGDVVADREARLEEAITGRHAPEAPAGNSRAWVWVLIVTIMVIALVWALFRSS